MIRGLPRPLSLRECRNKRSGSFLPGTRDDGERALLFLAQNSIPRIVEQKLLCCIPPTSFKVSHGR